MTVTHSEPGRKPEATRISLKGVHIRYGDLLAVRDVHLDIAPGDILALVGPSGCGKTSLLKSIAGLQEIDRGEVHFDHARIDRLPSHQRSVGMVFQNYALFPHMRVAENVGFGMRLKSAGVQPRDRQARVRRALEMLHIDALAQAWPDQLSGGQQQRVALARTLVLEPRVLLLDEPLSALDRQLRDDMRSEIRQLVKQVGITTVLVTHDQDEALSMADRIAVMRSGVIEQIGTPRELFDAPRTAFVARFMGRANALQAHCVGVQGPLLQVALGTSQWKASWTASETPPAPGDALTLLVRPDGLSVKAECDAVYEDAPASLPAQVTDQLFMGDKTELRLRLADGQTLRTEVAADAALPATGATAWLGANPLRTFAFRATTG